MKAAIVDGPIAPELFQRLESMGFEIVDMNDRDAMQGLRRRIEMDERFNDTDRMGIDDLKGKRIGMVGTFGHIGIGRECLAASIIPATPTVIHAVNRLNELAEQEAMQKAKESRFVMEIRDYMTDAIPDIRIDKTQDRFSPFDKFVGRGKGPARSQKFSNQRKTK